MAKIIKYFYTFLFAFVVAFASSINPFTSDELYADSPCECGVMSYSYINGIPFGGGCYLISTCAESWECFPCPDDELKQN